MTVLLQFNQVALDKDNTLSFSLTAGETRVLKLATPEAKLTFIDLVMGELAPLAGEILLSGQLPEMSKRGSIGWVPAAGGLISNLKTWENITLPLWYHSMVQGDATEETVARWLQELQLDQQEWEKFMASPVARLNPWERKMAGLLRGLLLAPKLLVVDAGVFEDVDAARAQIWITVLEKFVREAQDRAVLAVSYTETALPWKFIE
ncbi:MAG: hypothetical protein B7Y56_13775 [Gallionellales bacterium 35-53-114]|jgi:phospholipid/cholesterol/gamma-HCH transport system ATP-binding protein|nr:MAG: hypothetical protein B7Y56_13775 [Gallionellales bacterium 35-53-114]OYZ63002.1 MAG: hypothetical protein B7Y04_11040 [Gallionellales bacterium 24-53-125]OZB09017.1 MAG: hypothetical protein B7X61_08560 [Gallionellales bacterium 39-52-133]HQS59303.1 ATP-binding cassette domain-containing protein [Gallionellaceae bacterium]HQS76216.1 ATP-binding cassette domain-containing protein [Gallionellaceae bacterium]